MPGYVEQLDQDIMTSNNVKLESPETSENKGNSLNKDLIEHNFIMSNILMYLILVILSFFKVNSLPNFYFFFFAKKE